MPSAKDFLSDAMQPAKPSAASFLSDVMPPPRFEAPTITSQPSSRVPDATDVPGTTWGDLAAKTRLTDAEANTLGLPEWAKHAQRGIAGLGSSAVEPANVGLMAAGGAVPKLLGPLFTALAVKGLAKDVPTGLGKMSAGDMSGIEDAVQGGAMALPLLGLKKAPTAAEGAAKLLDSAKFGKSLEMDAIQGGKPVTRDVAPKQTIDLPVEKPVVPSTPPEPQRNLSVIEEIKAKNARTIGDIQKLFPDAQLNREQARVFRDQAWGKQEQPPATTAVTPPPPITQPVQGGPEPVAKPEVSPERVEPNTAPKADSSSGLVAKSVAAHEKPTTKKKIAAAEALDSAMQKAGVTDKAEFHQKVINGEIPEALPHVKTLLGKAAKDLPNVGERVEPQSVPPQPVQPPSVSPAPVEEPERIVATAVRATDGTVIRGSKPNTIHAKIIEEHENGGGDKTIAEDGGFITSKGRYVTRDEATQIANAGIKSIGAEHLTATGNLSKKNIELQRQFDAQDAAKRGQKPSAGEQASEVSTTTPPEQRPASPATLTPEVKSENNPPALQAVTPKPVERSKAPEVATPAQPPSKEPWQMTRREYSESKKSPLPADYEALDAIAKRNNRSSHNPDLITDDAVSRLKSRGYLSGTKNFKLTESGRAFLDDARRTQRENDLSSGDASDAHIDFVEQAIREGKQVPPEVRADYDNLPPQPPSGDGRGVEQSAPASLPTKYQLKNSGPQTWTKVRDLPPAQGDLPDERFVEVKNDRTGKVETVNANDLKPVKERAKTEKAPKQDVDAELKSRGYDTQGMTKAQKAETLKRSKAKGEPEIISMGGLAPSDPLEPVGKGGKDLGTSGAGQDIYGVAERVREARAERGQVAPVEPGKGISAPDSVNRGRQLLSEGVDAEKSLSEFERTKKLSSDDMAVVRAKGEQLAQAARSIEEKFGTNSREYKMAFDSLSAWDKRSKAMQTEWHKTGQAQQGETDLDTGSFTGLQRAYKESTGKDFTPEQTKEATKIVERTKKADTDLAKSKDELYKSTPGEPIGQDKAMDGLKDHKPGTKFSDKEVKTLWDRAKVYIEQGETDFDTIRHKLATDLGLSVDEVTKGLTQNKATKRMADDVWMKQQTARRIKDTAKRWLEQTAMPLHNRVLGKIPSAFFRLKVGGHGFVALGTHAPMVAFQPKFWGDYISNFGKMYKMVLNTPYYEMQMQNLVRRPNYVEAKRAGLVNDPTQYQEFDNPLILERFKGILGAGDRGYSVLKLLRQDMFDTFWDKLPESTRTPEVAKSIADSINHSTGITKSAAPRHASAVLFAPRLLGSRVAWLAVDPIKTGDILLKWKTATPAEKQFASMVIKEKMWVAGTMFGLLAANQGVLNLADAKQKINFTDATRSDWLKFKGAGMTASYGNPMLSMIRLPIRIGQTIESSKAGEKSKSRAYPDESAYAALGEFARSQESPMADFATDLAFGFDWQRRTLPNSQMKMPARLRAQGVKPYTWGEWLGETLSPIPFEEAEREVWKAGFGMSDEQMAIYRKALFTIAVNAGTGGRLVEDSEPHKK